VPEKPSDSIIEVEELCKSYGSVRAVEGLSFRVPTGAVVGFLGPNGAGKTTTLRILAGFIGATAGRAVVAGHDVALDSMSARRRIGYMPEACPSYTELQVGEYLRFRAELKRVARRRRRREVGRALEQAGAAEMTNVRIGHLSKGYRQRVGLADALIGAPPLLILDEPTAGLDPNQIRDVRRLLRSLAPKQTVLLSTHILSEVERICDRAIVIARGRLVAEGTIDDLRRRRRESSSLELTLHGDAERALKRIAEVGGVARAKLSAPARDGLAEVVVTLDREAADLDDADPAGALAERIVAALGDASIGVRRVAPAVGSLEQVFSELTGEPAAESLPEQEARR
jgi:ABC-2 type transport system ATP-binding protein